jgi:hypothetical protein
VAEDVMEHVRLGCELHLVTRPQVIGDQEDALGKLLIPVIGQGIADHRPLDVPARARGDALVEMRNCGNMLRIQVQQRQAVLELLADMLHEVWLVDSCIQVGPDRMLVFGKYDLLIFG